MRSPRGLEERTVDHPHDHNDTSHADRPSGSAAPGRSGADRVAPAGDAAFARWLAERAGRLLVELRAELGFGDPAKLRAEGDRRSHELLVAELARWRPGDAVLSEEGTRDEAADEARAAAERVWIVDPLDGTREFAEEGRTDWAVHVALWQRRAEAARRAPASETDLVASTGAVPSAGSAAAPGPAGGTDGAGRGEVRPMPGRLVAGAVGLPAQAGGTVLGTDIPPAYPPMLGGPIRLVASRTRPPAFLEALCERLAAEHPDGAVIVPMGSAGAKMAAVVQGTVDAYVHAGGQYEWDSAAPVAVAQAAGLHASRVDGAPLAYNRVDPWLPDVLVCRRDLAEPVLAALSRLEL
jgi:3'(2'), 5'-bisphosphate nucleotidase